MLFLIRKLWEWGKQTAALSSLWKTSTAEQGSVYGYLFPPDSSLDGESASCADFSSPPLYHPRLFCSCRRATLDAHQKMVQPMDSSSVLSHDDLSEYDFISDGQHSLESSIADLGLLDKAGAAIHEPAPARIAEDLFGTPTLTAEDIQSYVRTATGVVADKTRTRRLSDFGRKVLRVYVDGLFDPLDAG